MKKLDIKYAKVGNNLECSIDSLNKEEMIEIVNSVKQLPKIKVEELFEEKEHNPNLGVVKYIDSVLVDEIERQSVTFKWYVGTRNLTIQGKSLRLFDKGIQFLHENYTLIE